jgi:hypothetical protein
MPEHRMSKSFTPFPPWDGLQPWYVDLPTHRRQGCGGRLHPYEHDGEMHYCEKCQRRVKVDGDNQTTLDL